MWWRTSRFAMTAEHQRKHALARRLAQLGNVDQLEGHISLGMLRHKIRIDVFGELIVRPGLKHGVGFL